MVRKFKNKNNSSSSKLLKWLIGIVIAILGLIFVILNYVKSLEKPAFKTVATFYKFGPVRAMYEKDDITRLEILGSSRYDIEIINIGNSSAHNVQVNIAPIASEYPLINTWPITQITWKVDNHVLYTTIPVIAKGTSITLQINDIIPNNDKYVYIRFGGSAVPAFHINIVCEEGVIGGIHHHLGLGYGAIAILKDTKFES